MKSRALLPMTAPIVIISILLLVVGLIAAWNVHATDQSNSELLDLNVTSVRWAQEFEIHIRDIRTHMHNYLLTGDRKQLDAIPVFRPGADRALAEAERLATTEAEQVLISQARTGYNRMFRDLERLRQQSTAPDPEEVRQLTKHVTEEILGPAHQYLDYNLQNATQANDDNKRLATWTVAILLCLGVVGAVVGVFTGLALAQRFRRSIVKLNLTVQDAAGRLNEVTEPVTLSSGGDIQDVEETLSTISQRISAVVTQLHQSQREVLRAEQLAALGQLAAGLAHEFRNPLTAIKILVQSAASEGDAGNLAGKDLVILEKEISRLERSIQNFLDFARPPRLERQAFDLRLVLQQTMDLLSARANSHSVQWNSMLPNEPVMAHADMGQVRQVILNLLINALDVLPQGGTIGVELLQATSKEPGGSTREVVVRVIDNGPGLPAELGERIFEPFISTKETGLGLGLSICKRIVEAHDGTIAAANRPEGGTIFTVRLPLAAESDTNIRSWEANPGRAGERDHAAIANRG